MPFQHDNNYAMFMECIGKISASIEDSDISNFIILGDFNSAVDTAFESELLEFCTSYDLSISDYEFYGRDSGQYKVLVTILGNYLFIVTLIYRYYPCEFYFIREYTLCYAQSLSKV